MGRSPWNGARQAPPRDPSGGGRKKVQPGKRPPTHLPRTKAEKKTRPLTAQGHGRRGSAGTAHFRGSIRSKYLVLLIVLALAVVFLVLAGPIKRNLQASSELRTYQRELEAERQETRELEERRDRAQQTDYLIKQARRLGYVMRGEIPVIVVREEEEPGGSSLRMPSE